MSDGSITQTWGGRRLPVITADTHHGMWLEVTMEYPGSSLKEQVRSFGRPLCLFCFHEPFADNLIDDRLHKRRADPITLPIAFAKVQNEEVIVLSVHLEFMDPSKQIGHGRGTPLVDLAVT